MNDKITIKGARVHNLKNINLEIPKNKLVVVTGLLIFYIVSHVKKVNDGKVNYKLTKSDNLFIEVKDRTGKVIKDTVTKVNTIPLIVTLILLLIILVPLIPYLA